jgi:hypothetical protein
VAPTTDRRRRALAFLLLWLLFVLIAAGAGYGSMRYYDPRTRVANDSASLYHDLVVGQPSALTEGGGAFYENRVLVPWLARPIYRLANGRSGSWHPVFFALLVVNAAFLALAATLLVRLAGAASASATVGVLAALLLCANFATPNYYMAGLVDSAELAGFVLLPLALLHRRWWWLPAIAAVAATAKETFLPLGVAFACGWLAAGWRETAGRRSAVAAIAAMAGLSAGAMTLVAWSRGLPALWLRDVVPDPLSAADYLRGIVTLVTDRGLLYVFGWLLPLAAPSLRHVPAPWIAGSAAAAGVAFAVGLLGGEQSVSRALLNVAGPMLSLAAAITLLRIARAIDGATATGGR